MKAPKALKPIKKAVRRKWYFVKFSYEHLQSVPCYDAALDDLVHEDVRVGPIEVVVNQLAANEADAYKLVQEAAAVAVHPGTFSDSGHAITHIPIEGTVIILGVEEWVPKPKKKEELTWL